MAALGLGYACPSMAGATEPAVSGEQQEADYRVIAARCGTPAFERRFYHQSRAAVAAGLVSTNRDTAAVEKTITSLRRSPFVLVAASSDCKAQMAQLEALQKQRSSLVRISKSK
ncbi:MULTISPECIES: hypothetical protein [unclassified Variovorax]|uniref:hypothetical protein n=1 Tax=unclassified Variovorax TaxID=663243 RepID=UPI001BD45704|nr:MULTISPECIES: hypothetical protein [unclassified Variovorax]